MMPTRATKTYRYLSAIAIFAMMNYQKKQITFKQLSKSWMR